MKNRSDYSVYLSILFAVLCVLYIKVNGAVGLPNRGEYQSLRDYVESARESDVESSRAENPRRKASELKKPWLSDNLIDMETALVPPDYPLAGYGDNRGPVFPSPLGWDRPTQAGCGFFGGNICAGDADPCCDSYTYEFRLGMIIGTVTDVSVSGPISGWEYSAANWVTPTKIRVHIYPNIAHGTQIEITANTVGTDLRGRTSEGQCSTVLTWLCEEEEECECIGTTPAIYASSETIDPGGNITLYVDSEGLACPPYSWTVSGTGYSIDSTSENDLETVTLTSAGGT